MSVDGHLEKLDTKGEERGRQQQEDAGLFQDGSQRRIFQHTGRIQEKVRGSRKKGEEPCP